VKPGTRIRAVHYLFFQGNTAYQLEGFCPEGAFGKYESLFDWVIGSLQPLP
jgi:hypothetical protein